ncbi:MAG TPA: cytochrome c family protein [Acetobacteraceae bacterium]
MRHPATLAMAALAATLASGAARADGDPALGKVQFNKCAACHSAKAGENKIGPSLHGVVGRPSHSIDGFSYSDAMKAYNVTWTDEELNKYLENPRGVVVGTKMIFVGLKKEDERANLIAYLDTLK